MRYHLPLSDPLLETVDISVNLSGLQILDIMVHSSSA